MHAHIKYYSIKESPEGKSKNHWRYRKKITFEEQLLS